MKTKKTLLIIFSLSAFIACKDETSNINDKTIPEYSENGKFYEKVTQIVNSYNESNQLVKSLTISTEIEQNSTDIDTSLSIYSYNEKGKLIMEETFYNNNVTRFTWLYNYDNGDKLIKKVCVSNGKDTNSVLTNTYNETGELICEKRLTIIPGIDTIENYANIYIYKDSNRIAYEISTDKKNNTKDSILYEYKDTTLVKKLGYSKINSTITLDKITTYTNYGDTIKQELVSKNGGDTIMFKNKKYKNGLIEKEYSYPKTKNGKSYSLFDTKGNNIEDIFINFENNCTFFEFSKYDKLSNLIEKRVVSIKN